MPAIDLAELDDLLRETGRREIMPRFRRLDAGDVREKTSAVDLVTEADERAEAAIAAALAAWHPGALIVGEEAASADPRLLEGLATADLAFVIDPVDGTFNYAAGVPLFGVMLAVVSRGETVAGLIHDPVGDETLSAETGGGAFRRFSDGNRTRLAVAKPAPLAEMIGCVSWQYLDPPDRARVAASQTATRTYFNYRCSAYDYRMLATGTAHFVCSFNLMPWDHLAGALIHAEAGGHVARLDGSAYRPSHISGGLLCAPDIASWREIHAMLFAGGVPKV